MPETEAPEATQTETATETHPETAEARSTPAAAPGSLRVEDRNAATPRRGLADEFRSRGFPGEVATMPWEEYEQRAVTWSAAVDLLAAPVRREGVPLGFDVRYAWPAFPRVGVGADVTVGAGRSADRAGRSPTAANVVRAIDAATAKPETGSTINIASVSLHQVANIETNVPNVYLQSPTREHDHRERPQTRDQRGFGLSWCSLRSRARGSRPPGPTS